MSESTTHYEPWIEANLRVTLKTGNEWMCECPFHDDSTPSFQINAVTCMWVCFGCGEKGGPNKLAKLLDLDDPPEEYVDLDGLLEELEKLNQEENGPPVLPESFLRRFDHPTRYWKRRGLSKATQRLFRLGYDPLTDSATIPTRLPGGDLVGIIRRRMSDGWPRYVYPSGFNLRGTLFGSWHVGRAVDHLVICEGSIDCMALWQAGVPAVGTLGSRLYPEQAEQLRRLGINKVTLMFDNDKAGDQAAADALDGELLSGMLVWQVDWPLNVNDPASVKDGAVLRKMVKRAELA